MFRVRISTTVNAKRLHQARALVGGRLSELMDAALTAVVNERLNALEIAALRDHPYDRDPDLALPQALVNWEPELPYDGRVPPEVLALARKRRRARAS